MWQTKIFIPVLIIFSAYMPLSVHAAEPVRLTLEQAINRVAGDGRDVRIADKAQDVAEDQASMARAPLLPQVTASAGQTYYAYQPAAVSGGQKMRTSEKAFSSYGVDVYQTLFDFGATRARHQAAKSLADGVLDETVRVKNQSVLNVVLAYFDVLEAGRMIAVAEREIASLARHAKDVTILFREGVATKNDLLSASVRFNAARQKLVASRSQEKISSARIRELLSIQNEEDLLLEDTAVPVRFDITLQQAFASASRCRPELRAMQKSLRAAGFNEQASRSSDKPVIFADGGYSYADNRYQARDDNWHAVLGVKLSIFNGGLTKAEHAHAAHEKEQLIEEEKKLEESIRFEIQKDHWDMNNARQRMTLSRNGAAQADENARVVETRYIEGVGTASDVLEALAMRTSAETDLGRSTYELKRSYARLLYAMGMDVAKILKEGAYAFDQ
jgi:outer membrane protein